MWLHNTFSGTASQLKKLSCLFPSIVPLVPKERRQFYFNMGHNCDYRLQHSPSKSCCVYKTKEAANSSVCWEAEERGSLRGHLIHTMKQPPLPFSYISGTSWFIIPHRKAKLFLCLYSHPFFPTLGILLSLGHQFLSRDSLLSTVPKGKTSRYQNIHTYI